MEARRLDRERRNSAKSSAAESLPSTQDKDFHLRLVDLYRQHPCLWNTTLTDYEDAELKREAWQNISKQLGAHLTPAFVRSRVSRMLYRLNVYKLQMIEHNMSPASGRQPEKLYFIDGFAFLDEINSPSAEKEPSSSESDLSLAAKKQRNEINPTPSIANIFKQRVQQQKQQPQANQLPNVLQRLSLSDRRSAVKEFSLGKSAEPSIASVVKQRMLQSSSLKADRTIPDTLQSARRMLQEVQQNKHSSGDQLLAAAAKVAGRPGGLMATDSDHMLKQRMHRLGQVEMGRESMSDSMDSSDMRGSLVNIPTVVKKRMRQQLPLSVLRMPEMELERSSPKVGLKSNVQQKDSMSGLSKVGSTLRALPGESVSMMNIIKKKSSKALDSADPSDDEDFYRLHWSVRQKHRSRRSAGLSVTRDPISQAVPPLLLGKKATSSIKITEIRD